MNAKQNLDIQTCENCLSDRVLAAFIEGHLRGEKRAEVLKHLDTCERCFEMTTMAMSLDETEKSGKGELVQGRFRKGPAMASVAGLAIAALLLFVLNPALFLDPEISYENAEIATREALISLGQGGVELEALRLDLDVAQKDVRASIQGYRTSASGLIVNRQIEEARRAWQDVLSRDPKHVHALEQLTSLLLLTRDFAEARLISARLAEVKPMAKTRAYKYMATFYDDPDPKNPALEAMAKLYLDHQNNPLVTYNYGRMLMKVNAEPSEIRTVWQHYLQLDANSIYADVVRGFLENR